MKKITWKRTENRLHGQEVEIFEDGESVAKIWVSQEAEDEDIDAQIGARLADWKEEQVRRKEMGVRE